MIIHEMNVKHVAGLTWSYRAQLFGNFVTIQFFSDLGEVPRTGDQIINNRLVKFSND